MHTGDFVIGRCGAVLSLGCGRILLGAVLGTFVLTGMATAQASPPPPPPPSAPLSAPLPTMSAAELAILDAVNDFRASKGRDAWVAERGLAAAARAHSQSMAADGRFSHDGFRRRAENTGSALCVENLLHGPAPPARAVQMWLRSDSHRDNLLEPAARVAGVGMAGRFVTLLACATAPPAPHPDYPPAPAVARPDRP